jgi:hypothetical protein
MLARPNHETFAYRHFERRHRRVLFFFPAVGLQQRTTGGCRPPHRVGRRSEGKGLFGSSEPGHAGGRYERPCRSSARRWNGQTWRLPIAKRWRHGCRSKFPLCDSFLQATTPSFSDEDPAHPMMARGAGYNDQQRTNERSVAVCRPGAYGFSTPAPAGPYP